MSLYDTKFQELIRKHLSDSEKIIMDAFQAHFGFPISQVKDIENLEKVRQEGNPEDAYRYRGETFLYMNHMRDIQFNDTDNGYEVKISLSYKKV